MCQDDTLESFTSLQPYFIIYYPVETENTLLRFNQQITKTILSKI